MWFVLEVLYNSISLPASLLAGVLLAFNRRGRERIAERFGNWRGVTGEYTWFHGASAGEVNGLLPVIQRYKAQNPSAKILVTATTITGLDRAKEIADVVRLLPFDNWIWINRALKNLQLKLFVFGETELWPALMCYLPRRGVQLCLVNARISDYTFSRYRFFMPIIRSLLRRVSCILAADGLSAQRFITLGAFAEHVAVVGNAKYDILPSISSVAEAASLRASFFCNDAPVITLGSLRPGEEAIWFPAIREATSLGHKFNIVVAPRHKDKFELFAQVLKQHGIKFVRRSELGTGLAEHNTVLLDTFGELERVYSFSEVVFVGATLVDLGGHNPLEPAAYASALVVGPYIRNIREVVEALTRFDAVTTVRTVSEALQVIVEVCSQREMIKARGARALEVWRLNIGASERIMRQLSLLKPAMNVGQ